MERLFYLRQIEDNFRIHSVCAILGARQVGKTTLAKQFIKDQETVFFDLENPLDLARLENPMLTLLRYIINSLLLMKFNGSLSYSPY